MLRKNLPNLITLGNLASGCIGIQLILSGRPEWVPWCIIISAVFDFFDGAAARLLNAHSAIGKDLDSLADMVSFGVLPGLLAWELTLSAAADNSSLTGEEPLMFIFRYVHLLIPLLSAWRLARFNNDPAQAQTFSGLPTPANALFWAGLAFGIYGGQYEILYLPLLLTVLSIIMSLLLVVKLPMFSLKFKTVAWKNNRLRYIFLLVATPLLLGLGIMGLAPVILLYVMMSMALAATRTTSQA